MAGMTSSTSRTGMTVTSGYAQRAGEQRPEPATGQQPERQPGEQGRRGQRHGLPAHDEQKLRAEQAEGLEDSQVPVPAVDTGHQHVGQRPDREQGQQHAESQRGVPHRRVVADVSGTLIAGQQADPGLAARPGDGSRQPGGGRGQVDAWAVADQDEVVAGAGPGAQRRVRHRQQPRRHGSTRAQVGRSGGGLAEERERGHPGNPQPPGGPVEADRDQLADVPARGAHGPLAEHHLAGSLRRVAGQQGEEVPAV